MSIVIKKKAKYNKKRLLQRIAILTFIYFLSFSLLYIFFGEKPQDISETEAFPNQIVYENEGEKMLALGEYTNAVEYYIKAFTENPEDAVSLNRLAKAYYHLGQHDKAKFYFYKSVELAPKYIDNYVQVAMIYIDEKDYLTAENVIDKMPLKTKKDFIEKGKILTKLARAEISLEDKIIHYTKALSYFKKYDKELYENNMPRFIDSYFTLAQYYVDTNNINEAVKIYRNMLKYTDSCDVHNRLAFAYKNISTDMVLWHIKKAVNMAKTQDEKRVTKQNLIQLRNYFEKQNDTDNALIVKEFMEKLDESKILVDEKYTEVKVVNESFNFVLDKDELYPEVIFSLQNQSDKSVAPISAKAEIYITKTPKRIIETAMAPVVLRDVPLKSGEITKPVTIRIGKNIPADKVNKYTVALSISSDNGKTWMLFRLFQK